MVSVATKASSDEIHLLVGALTNIDQAVLLVDGRHRIAYTNPQFCALFKLPPALVRPGSTTRRLHRFLADTGEYGDGDANELVRQRESVIESRSRYRLERLRPNGMYIEVVGNPVAGFGYVFTFTDVTERKLRQLDLEAAVQERTEELRRANRELARLANLDPLLGIINRRAFMQIAEEKCRAARAAGQPLAVLMVDLDHFKSINDRFGHAGGDLVLAAAARAMQDVIGADDVLARHGGEEFVILLSNSTVEGAVATAEALRRAIAGIELDLAGQCARITASIGVSTVALSEPTVSVAIVRADMAVYSAKAAGRDRVICLPA